MLNVLQASTTESISKQVYTRTQGILYKFPIYIFDFNFLNKKVICIFLLIFNYQALIESWNG